MTESTFLDRVRDLLEGRLAPADAARVHEEIAADPEKRAVFERFREVHAFTVEGTAPATDLRADDLLRAASGGRVFLLRPRIRPLAAAAVLLAAAAAVVAANGLLFSDPEPRFVALAALRAPGTAPAAAADEPPPVPGTLATYEPIRDGRPNWLETWDEGEALARATGKAMLVFVYHPTCPICTGMDATTFRDGGVQGRIAEFVPVRIDVMQAPDEVRRRMEENGKWPYLAAVEGDGRTLHDLSGIWELDDLPAAFARADEETRRADPARPTWERIRAAVRDLAAAEEAERAGRLGDAAAAARRAAEEAPSTAVAERAAWRAERLGRTADEALAQAAATAGTDVPAALRAVEEEARRFAGSAQGEEFAVVAQAIRETGAFPVFQEVRR